MRGNNDSIHQDYQIYHAQGCDRCCLAFPEFSLDGANHSLCPLSLGQPPAENQA